MNAIAKKDPQASDINTSSAILYPVPKLFYCDNVVQNAMSYAVGVAMINGIIKRTFYLNEKPCFIPKITSHETSHHLCSEIPINRNKADWNSWDIPSAIPSDMS